MISNGQSERPGQTWKVGALARATGLTVRTLHYYDEIGLLQPSARLAGGHRLYGAADVGRLYRIIRLRQLGLYRVRATRPAVWHQGVWRERPRGTTLVVPLPAGIGNMTVWTSRSEVKRRRRGCVGFPGAFCTPVSRPRAQPHLTS